MKRKRYLSWFRFKYISAWLAQGQTEPVEETKDLLFLLRHLPAPKPSKPAENGEKETTEEEDIWADLQPLEFPVAATEQRTPEPLEAEPQVVRCLAEYLQYSAANAIFYEQHNCSPCTPQLCLLLFRTQKKRNSLNSGLETKDLKKRSCKPTYKTTKRRSGGSICWPKLNK